MVMATVMKKGTFHASKEISAEWKPTSIIAAMTPPFAIAKRKKRRSYKTTDQIAVQGRYRWKPG